MPQPYAAYQITPPIFAGSGLGVEDMRDLLRRKRPATTAEALRLLREAYPTSPLRLRIAACEG